MDEQKQMEIEEKAAELEQRERVSLRRGMAALTLGMMLFIGLIFYVVTPMPVQWCFALPALYTLVLRTFFMYTDV